MTQVVWFQDLLSSLYTEHCKTNEDFQQELNIAHLPTLALGLMGFCQ